MFKIQITKSRTDVENHFEARLRQLLVTLRAIAGVFGFERGKRNRQLHIQGVVKLLFPDTKDCCTYIRQLIYDFMPCRPCDGYKVAVDP